MKSEKFQLYTSMKSKKSQPRGLKTKIIDFIVFFLISISGVALIGITTELFRSPLQMILVILLLIPTIIALVTGAPFVPTPMKRVKKMLALAKIKKGEKVYDIGCGDGRMVYLAAKNYQANAIGLELSPLVYLLAKIRQLFWQSKAKIYFSDFRFQNLSKADVIVCYLLPESLARLQQKLDLELKKGARVVSYAFPIGTWKVKQRIERDPEQNLAPIWMYER